METNVYCNSCNSCNYCKNCKNSNYCDSCNSCDYCDYSKNCNNSNSCDFCNNSKNCNYCKNSNYSNSCFSCNYCDYCNYSNSCNNSNFCDYCKNLKWTEYNYFCHAEDLEKDWLQPAKYRVFNKEISEKEYFKIKKIGSKLIFNKDESEDTKFETAFKKMRDNLSKEWKQEYLDIPYFNSEIFKKITWVNVENIEMTLEEVCEELWKNIKIVKIVKKIL